MLCDLHWENCQQNRNTRQFNQYTACRHCHRPRRQKQSAAGTIHSLGFARAARLQAPSYPAHRGADAQGDCTPGPGVVFPLNFKISTGILLCYFLNLGEMPLSPLMLQSAAAVPFLSASWRFSKRRGTTSAIEEFPRIFSRQSKVPWDTA